MINLYSLIIFMDINKKLSKELFVFKKYSYKDIKYKDEIEPLIKNF
jgi:hypothetical protein